MDKKTETLIGQKFDMLTVIGIIDNNNDAKNDDNKIRILYRCKCDCGNEITVKQSYLKRQNAVIHSCGCTRTANPNYKNKRLSKEDALAWDELYDYVRTNVMGYDKTQSLSPYMVSRLKGLLTGKFMENYKIPDKANYSYKTILTTFKFCIMDIRRSIRSKTFKDENNKFNYILKIVSNNINNVYLRMKKTEEANEKAEKSDTKHIEKYVNTFKQRKPSNNSHRYDDLW